MKVKCNKRTAKSKKSNFFYNAPFVQNMRIDLSELQLWENRRVRGRGRVRGRRRLTTGQAWLARHRGALALHSQLPPSWTHCQQHISKPPPRRTPPAYNHPPERWHTSTVLPTVRPGSGGLVVVAARTTCSSSLKKESGSLTLPVIFNKIVDALKPLCVCHEDALILGDSDSSQLKAVGWLCLHRAIKFPWMHNVSSSFSRGLKEAAVGRSVGCGRRFETFLAGTSKFAFAKWGCKTFSVHNTGSFTSSFPCSADAGC